MDSLSSRLVAACGQSAARGDARLQGRAADIARSLQEPMRVAVAGRVDAGKSTLVNALLGRRVAPTDPTETTRLVTWYRSGDLDAVRIHLRDGSVPSVPLSPEGQVPTDLPVPIESVDHVEVTLTDSILRGLTVIDTPGLSSMNSTNSDRSLALLDTGPASVDAVLQADAVLYVFTAALRGDEREVLRAFTGGTSSPAGALGVLSKIDTIVGVDDDPWPQAHDLARAFVTELDGQVSDIVPVVGLLAETTESGALTEADAAAIRALAAVPPDELARLMRSVDRFVTRDAPVPSAQRARLLQRLDLHGVRVAIDAVTGGASNAVDLMAVLQASSGIDAVRAAVALTFERRGDVIKASRALDQLAELAWDREVARPDRMWLADLVETIRLDPAMHAVAELTAVNRVASGAVHLPADLVQSLRLLALGSTPGERLAVAPDSLVDQLADAARALAARFRQYANAAAPMEAEVARIAERSCQVLTAQLAAGEEVLR